MVLMQKNVVKGRKIWYNKGAYKCKKNHRYANTYGFIYIKFITEF